MSLVNTLRTMPRYRLTVLAVFLVAACGVCGSFFGQYVLKMNPCVMCIQQRLALVATMLLALFCVALPHRKLLGRTLAALLISALRRLALGWRQSRFICSRCRLPSSPIAARAVVRFEKQAVV